MKRVLRTYFLFLAAALTSACSRTVEPDSLFIADEGIQLKVNGQVIRSYDPLTDQLGYDDASREFTLSDDAMKSYFVVTCSRVPSSVGQKLDATISYSYTYSDEVKSIKGSFEVAKKDGDTYWLWCGEKKNRTGVTVRILR